MRFPTLTPETMDERQREIAARIAGRRGGTGLQGPFNLWLRAPELCDRLQRVGQYVRYETATPRRLVELAICAVAVEWGARYEWYAHARFALEAGLDRAVLVALRDGRDVAEPEEAAAVLAFCRELHRERRVCDATFARAKALFGEEGVAQLVAASGYYVAVSMALNVSEVPLPEGVEPFAIPG
jgi:4-carboxymuconolactone decarboxylase